MKKILDIIRRTADLLDRIFRAVTFAGLIVMLVLGTIEIFSRFVLNHSFVWIPGMVILSSNWLIFLGMGVYLHRRQNMEVTYFYDRFFSRRMQAIADTAVDLFLMVVLAVLIKNTFQVMMMEQYQSSLINLPIKAYWYTMPLLLGCLLAILSRVEGLAAAFLEKNEGLETR